MNTISPGKALAGRYIISSGKRQYYYQGNQRCSFHHMICQNYHHVCSSQHHNRYEKDDENQSQKQQYRLLQNSFIGMNHRPSSSLTFTPSNSKRDDCQSRYYVTYTKPKQRSGVTLVMGLGAVAATAKAGQYVVQAYNEWKESSPPSEELQEEKSEKEQKGEDTTMNTKGNKAGEETKKEQKTKSTKADGKRENIFAKFFNLNVGSKYYEGGFEDKMTRREAALILGVRESSTPKRIKDAHRKLLILNHPDTGGSTFLAGKINEAKELLLKGKNK